jgi:hypothetical protein
MLGGKKTQNVDNIKILQMFSNIKSQVFSANNALSECALIVSSVFMLFGYFSKNFSK